MELRTLVAAAGLAVVGLSAADRPQAAALEKRRIVFAPPKHAAWILTYDKSESWDYGDRRGQEHVTWTMRDTIATVTKKGKVFVDGAFESVDYKVHYFADGADHDEAFRWSADGGYADGKGEAVEKVGKSEIPKGLHLVLDDRGAAEHGEC